MGTQHCLNYTAYKIVSCVGIFTNKGAAGRRGLRHFARLYPSWAAKGDES
jgi:hypothetical protein